jgi:hypothetical protein
LCGWERALQGAVGEERNCAAGSRPPILRLRRASFVAARPALLFTVQSLSPCFVRAVTRATGCFEIGNHLCASDRRSRAHPQEGAAIAPGTGVRPDAQYSCATCLFLFPHVPQA